MSRGLINIVLYDIDQTHETLTAFREDPASFLNTYRLSTGERNAFETWDYGALYAMGAHPFLLFQTVRSLAALDEVPLPTLLADYRAAIEPHGYPDFIT